MGTTNQNAPDFTPEQEQAILRAAGRKVALSICHIDDRILPDDLAGAGDLPVYGAFVSLKRFRQLRACCGWLGESLHLLEALDNAAYRAAVDDLRFPTIQPAEINEMEMEVWTLYGLERIVPEGLQRDNFVEIGAHGLVVAKGERRGLLLPGVATEMNLGPRPFLEHTCRKAGLKPDAWRDPDTVVFRFRGVVLRETLRNTLSEAVLEQVQLPPSGPGTRELAKLADHCYRNIRKLAQEATPDYYLPGAFDGLVSGACLRIRLDRMSADCAQIHLADPQPLQATLLQLSQNAALAMRQNGFSAELPFKTSLGVFWDAQRIGTAEGVDVSHLDTQRTGLIALRFGRWTLAYAPGKRPEALLQDVVDYSRFAKDADTQIFSARVASTDVSFITTTVQKPYEKTDARLPFVAGQFYPREPAQINQVLDSLMAGDVEQDDYAAAVVPHAGWMYSGGLAMQTLRRVKFATRVLIFAPKHQPNGCDWAVTPTARWNLPGRPMEGDVNLSRALVEAVPQFELDALAHEREHAIEVLLPFLTRLCPGSHVVGAVMAGGDAKVREAAEALAGWIRTLPVRPTLIASTDMNHYASDEQTRELDGPVIQAMLDRDPERMLELVRTNHVSMCGVLPVALVMTTLRELGALNHAVQVGYATSGDVSGDRKRVVGYCGMLFK